MTPKDWWRFNTLFINCMVGLALVVAIGNAWALLFAFMFGVTGGIASEAMRQISQGDR